MERIVYYSHCIYKSRSKTLKKGTVQLPFLLHWPSVTILSSSGLRIPSSGSSGSDRGVLRPAWDGGAARELSARGPMSRPAVETHNDIQKQLKTYRHKHTLITTITPIPSKNLILDIEMRYDYVYCLSSWGDESNLGSSVGFLCCYRQWREGKQVVPIPQLG